MTIVTGEWLTFSAIGMREDLADKIWQISPTEVPLSAMLDNQKAEAVTVEWQTDALAAAAANAQLEGDAFTFAAPTATARVVNTTQIYYKTCNVSKTLDRVSKAGRDREFVYQARQRGLEVKRDIEFSYLNNQTPVPQGSAGAATARALRPLNAWITTNDFRGTGGSDGSASAAATDASAGNRRDLDEGMVQQALRTCWSAGGKPDVIMVGPFNKQRISTFGGNATRYVNADLSRLIAGIAFYESDFGVHKVIPNRFSRDRDCWILDSNYWGKATLRPMTTEDTPVAADGYFGVVLEESTLVSRNQAASAVIADLTEA